MQPIIRNDINVAFEKSSFPNITIKTKRGIVYSGFPAIEIKFAILFIFNISTFQQNPNPSFRHFSQYTGISGKY